MSPRGAQSPRGCVQVQHWWDALCAGCCALTPRGVPPQHLDRVLCHQGTPGTGTGWADGQIGAEPLPGIPWGVLPLRSRTRNPVGVGLGRRCLGHPTAATPAVMGLPPPPSRSHSSVKAVFLAALAAGPAAAPAPPAFCILSFWQRGFFHHSHSQM